MTTHRRCCSQDQFTVIVILSSKESVFGIRITIGRGEDEETSTEQHRLCFYEVTTGLYLLLLSLILAMAQKDLCWKH